MTPDDISIERMKRLLTDEIFIAVGLSPTGWLRRALGPLFAVPTKRFVEIAANFDYRVAQSGLRAACEWVLPRFVEKVEVVGADQIPDHGPLLIAANHPGAYDGLTILAHVPRDDVKIIISGAPFFRTMPNSAPHLIHTSPNTFGQMTVVRTTLRHLQSGGALLLFPTGQVDPDPAVMSGAPEALSSWSPSIEFILRKAPQTRVQIAIVSGILAPSCLRNPITRLRRGRLERQKLAEFLQVIQQMVLGTKFDLSPRVSFASPFSMADLGAHLDPRDTLTAIVKRAQSLLAAHMTSYVSQPVQL